MTTSAPPPATQLTPLAPALGGGFQPRWVAAGRAHVCGLEPGTNSLKCFGANARSQLDRLTWFRHGVAMGVVQLVLVRIHLLGLHA